MSTTIRITIEVAGEAHVSVEGPSPEGPGPADLRAAAQRTFADELVPLPPEAAEVGPFATIARTQEAARAAGGAVCPVHNEPWRLVPAGVSKSTGRSYDAFRACPVKGCRERPAA